MNVTQTKLAGVLILEPKVSAKDAVTLAAAEVFG